MRLPNYWFRSAITGRFVSRLFAQGHKAETVEETWVPPTTSRNSNAHLPRTRTSSTTTSGGAYGVTITAPTPYPFPKTITGIGSPFKAQIRCRLCDKLTPVDAACRWCQSELDDGENGVPA